MNFKSVLLPEDIIKYTETLGGKISSNKGVYTVLITLGVYKTLHPEQDIRYHKVELTNGFSGRSFDTQHITPLLKELGLPSMAESGWLTRSLEQADAYTLSYQGKITPTTIKEAFLNLVNHLETNPENAEDLVKTIISYAIKNREENQITITPIKNPESLTIDKIMKILELHFSEKYPVAGGSKLPVLAFYAIYSSLINELQRYDNCELGKLGSHTASDRTSKSSGDIEIMKDSQVFESIEIKQDRLIDSNILRIAQEKIYKFNPDRYYILSYAGIKEDEKLVIDTLIMETKRTHGCQIIVNGIMNTIRYYLRLISSPEAFILDYSKLVAEDKELNIVHRKKLNEILESV